MLLALLTWLLLPASETSRRVRSDSGLAAAEPTAAAATSPHPSEVAESGAGDAAPSVGPRADSIATGSATNATAAATAVAQSAARSGSLGCKSKAASGPGVTAGQIKIVIILVNIAGPAANSAFGVAAPASQRAVYDAVIDSINIGGGLACRKVVAQYLDVNPADQADQQQKCLDAVQAAPFAVIDGGSYGFTSPVCFSQHQVPYFGQFFITTKQGSQGYPYLFNLENYDHLYRDTVLGFRDRGAFDPAKGFKKLGFFYRSCHPELISQELAAFHQAGLKDSQIVTYDFGCPSAFTAPSDLAQAILKFRQAGVTHATAVYAYGDLANFTNIAEQQGFRPQYLLADDGIIAISYGNLRPNPDNIVNALAVTASRYAEERTRGLGPTAGTAKCDAIFKAHGLRPAYESDPQAGNSCNSLWMLKAAAEHAPALRNDALGAGLQAARSIDFSYPSGPNDFSGPKVTTGGQFWRVAQYFASCSCWRVIDSTFHPSYS